MPATGSGLTNTDAEQTDLGKLANALIALDYDCHLAARPDRGAICTCVIRGRRS
jgi:hypothetical protein